MSAVREIAGWEPIEPSVAANCPGAQIVNGQWYSPKWDCDSLGDTIEAYDQSCRERDEARAVAHEATRLCAGLVDSLQSWEVRGHQEDGAWPSDLWNDVRALEMRAKALGGGE